MKPIRKFFRNLLTAKAKFKEYHLIENDSDVSLLIKFLKKEKTIGIDTEFDWRNTYYPKLSLLQISFKDIIFIIDCIKCKNLSFLKNYLEDQNLMDYDLQLENYIKNNLGIKNYKINFLEKGAIPLFYPFLKNENQINIGSAGGMTRLSTGYTFLNIQEHSRYIVKNLDKIEKVKTFNLGKKYQFLDKVFLRVLEKHPEKMPKIFFEMFKAPSDTVIKFLSNKSNIFEDINIISKMPKFIFIKALFN